MIADVLTGDHGNKEGRPQGRPFLFLTGKEVSEPLARGVLDGVAAGSWTTAEGSGKRREVILMK
jgi:hypothetical protein